MKFLKYQHVERLGTDETEGILDGECWIFPKIDGTNASVWLDNSQISAGSRNRELTLENDNAGFLAWVIKQSNIIKLLLKYPNFRLYGEWLVPHTLKTYSETAWRNFYVFDVMENDKYLSYNEYSKILDEYGISYIPPIGLIKNPNEESLFKCLDKNTFLIEDGKGTGEGIVIKNYYYENKYHRVTWAKIVKNEFKEQNKKAFGINEFKATKLIEEDIVHEFCTSALIDKEYAKIVTESNGWKSEYIPRLLHTIYYCLVTEDIWNIIKKYKNPVIDFKRIIRFVNIKVKSVKPELF